MSIILPNRPNTGICFLARRKQIESPGFNIMAHQIKPFPFGGNRTCYPAHLSLLFSLPLAFWSEESETCPLWFVNYYFLIHFLFILMFKFYMHGMICFLNYFFDLIIIIITLKANFIERLLSATHFCILEIILQGVHHHSYFTEKQIEFLKWWLPCLGHTVVDSIEYLFGLIQHSLPFLYYHTNHWTHWHLSSLFPGSLPTQSLGSVHILPYSLIH